MALFFLLTTLILQRPVTIYEGRPLNLKCHSRFGCKVINTTFYKEDEEIQTSTIGSELHLKKVDGDVTGKYRCTKVIEDDDGSLHTLSHESYIHVTMWTRRSAGVGAKRLLSSPPLTSSILSPPCHEDGLTFALNKREGRKVQEFSSSDTYRAPSVQSEDPGNYTCEVMTPMIRKMSDVSYVHVQELFSFPEIKVPLH
ncbi:unnamed protein product [Ranitomeya imitator]|uniref:Ig-like domain-containing protein n=1 Tax=Ranitomeya imitator TaxID=111125 RepID=A0ABN9KTS6_9NEOB|nr:unnamed protein product [Ranitomeya imitator]